MGCIKCDGNELHVFAGDLSNWDVSSVTDMSYMFHNAASFNSDIQSWDASSVENMNKMFGDATLFDQELGNWSMGR
ncbi:MAG: hypothetical protein ACJATI_001324 [Halioglobus sp.]